MNFSRTCWITFHWRGITSSVSVTSSPSLERRDPPQQGQARRRRDHHPLARQMLGERLARRPLAREGRDRRRLGRGRLGGELVLGRRRLQLFELQLQLVEQARRCARSAGRRARARSFSICSFRWAISAWSSDGLALAAAASASAASRRSRRRPAPPSALRHRREPLAFASSCPSRDHRSARFVAPLNLPREFTMS